MLQGSYFEITQEYNILKMSENEMIKTTVKFTYTNTITYNIFFRFKIQSSLSLLPVCIQIFIQLQFDSNFFLVSFLICEIFIELRMTSIVLLLSYKESKKKVCNNTILFLTLKKFLKNSTENHQFWRCWHSFSLIQTKLCYCLKQHGLLVITGYNWLKS